MEIARFNKQQLNEERDALKTRKKYKNPIFHNKIKISIEEGKEQKWHWIKLKPWYWRQIWEVITAQRENGNKNFNYDRKK